MKPDVYDIVVVGAGPAGSMAAEAAAVNGAKTLLIERKEIIGQPQRCGGVTLLSCLQPFFTPRKKWILSEISRTVLYAPDGTAIELKTNSETGVVLNRVLFDQWLAERAAQAGADIISGGTVTGLVFKDQFVTGVNFMQDGQQKSVQAAIVIGADGVESRIGRWAGISPPLSLNNLSNAYQMTLDEIDYDDGAVHFFWGSKIAPYGYAWIFPVGKRTAHVGIGFLASKNKPGSAYKKLNEFVKYRFGNPKILDEVAGGLPVGKPLHTPVGNGVILAGDAAWHCDPLTGAGIHTALIAGNAAGKTASKAISEGDISAYGLREYTRRIDNEFGTHHRKLYRFRDAALRQTDDQLNRLAGIIAKIPVGKRTMRGIILRAFVSSPGKLIKVLSALYFS
ncbi:MAG: NAD(P)/FAD-dependent oxidoreductase [Candidatus Electryonea clarkiae]|nr:NAD(P)/FAD-dependent oxidoreductase [Candidatus Electryonea clarkiae]MDP8286841.1 NAD(P)/FAD-dependent oxidoreductase [Candidatus Electryonea clarkiae]